MTNDYRQTWDTYSDTWRANTTADRKKVFETCLSTECVYTDPVAQVTGWDQLSGYMDAFQTQFSGCHFVIKTFFSHNNRSLAVWDMCNADGEVVSDGVSYGEYDDAGKLKTMTGFFETP